MFTQSSLDARRQRFIAQLPNDLTIAIYAGSPIQIPGGLDQHYPFVPHPEYYWLTGARRQHGVLAYDGAQWIHFVEPVSASERLWDGEAEAPDGVDVCEFDKWLASQKRPVASLGATESSVETAVQNAIDAARRPKDAHEIELMRRAVSATAAGHYRAAKMIQAGVTERQLQIELEAAMYHAGAHAMGYHTIVASGHRAAILHGSPTSRAFGPNDCVLVDAGGSVDGYTADVTRTYYVGAPSGAQRAIYDVVLQAELDGIDAIRPGVEWHDVHRACATTIAQGLVDLQVLRGDAAELAESGVVALFFPHGVGHLVGLGVRDVGGRAPGRAMGRKCCGVAVRIDLPLEAGFIVTVEPGIYFVDGLLADARDKDLHRGHIDWDKVQEFVGIGGVRIEDNLLVTNDGCENLTAMIPKNISWNVDMAPVGSSR